MVRKSFISKQKPRKLVVTQKFKDDFLLFANYTSYVFGRNVADTFVLNVNKEIAKLLIFPDANPKCKYKISTDKKTYRIIKINEVLILYSVTKTIIKIICIYHSHTDPGTISKL